jgi:hypothetical protein
MCIFQEEVFKFPRTWPHRTEFKCYTYNYSKEVVPKINDYRLKCA